MSKEVDAYLKRLKAMLASLKADPKSKAKEGEDDFSDFFDFKEQDNKTKRKRKKQ